MTKPKLLLFGGKSFADTTEELASICGYEVIARIDDYDPRPPYVVTLDAASQMYDPASHFIALAIGYKNLRARLTAYQRIKQLGYRAATLIHPTAYVSPTASIGSGSLVMAQSCVDCRSSIGDVCVLWPKACINHDTSVERNTFISPNATLCGNVRVGESSFIGASAIIVDGASLAPNTFLKMGTVYTKRSAA
jgi:sugar O-acyltransferase (sialic acid O-acetyltransferase NeuD family)